MKPNFSIEGKRIVITGAAGILCSEMAKEMAELGAKIALCDLNEERGAKLAEEIKAAGGEAAFFKTNVLDKENLKQVLEAINKTYGGVDILINGAGGNKKNATVSPDLSFFDLPSDALQAVFNLNFIGTLLTSQVFGKQMAEKRRRMHYQYFVHDLHYAPYQRGGLRRGQSVNQQLHPMACRTYESELLPPYPRERNCSRFPFDRPESFSAY